MSIPILNTPRLRIREYTYDDLEARHNLMIQAFGGSETLDDTRAWLSWTIASYRQFASLYQPPYGDYAITLAETQESVGSIGLVPSIIPWDVLLADEAPSSYLLTPEFGLFWAINSAHQGRGYATEAATVFVSHLFASHRIKRLVATTETENMASVKVMQKLGMHCLRNRHQIPDWCQVVGVLAHPSTTDATLA